MDEAQVLCRACKASLHGLIGVIGGELEGAMVVGGGGGVVDLRHLESKERVS